MKVVKKKSNFVSDDIYLIDNNKSLILTYGGNQDLYFIIDNNEVKSNNYSFDYFDITKENYALYSLFNKLINDIKEINIYDEEDDEFSKEYDEINKIRYRKHNMSNYNYLYNEKEESITWISDETAFEVANGFKIRMIDEKIRIEFFTQPYIEGYEQEQNIYGRIAVRISNSGSRYDPFNIVFMKLFNNMQEIDDINDIYHQIHIYEYLNSIKKNQEMKLIKK